MPTRKPRVAIALDDAVLASIRNLAHASGKPVASVIADLLTEMTPQLDDIAKMMRLTKAGKGAAARKVLQRMYGDSVARALTATQPELFEGKKK